MILKMGCGICVNKQVKKEFVIWVIGGKLQGSTTNAKTVKWEWAWSTQGSEIRPALFVYSGNEDKN